jgi:hypothetical protein
MVALPTLSAGFRLVLHGMSSEMGHWFLNQRKQEQKKLNGHG